MEGKYIIASGPVIIEDGKLLVDKDDKDDFYKLPGGRVEEGDKSLEYTCIRETKEEINGDVQIIKKLSTMILTKNPQTGKSMKIELHHFLSKLGNINEIKPISPIKEVRWLDVDEIKQGKYNVAPNIKFLIEKGDIKC